MRGQCMLIPSGGNGYKHLFTVVIDPVILPHAGGHPIVVLVNFTSIRDNAPYEDACVVQAGEHPFIRHRSYVTYRYARIESVERIKDLLKKGVFVEKEPCSPELLEKILQGALKSKLISREIKRIIEQSLAKQIS